MSSLFATGVKRRQSPAWCKKGMYPKISGQIDGRPALLNAYANWNELSSGREIYLIQTFNLSKVPSVVEWYGSFSDVGPNLTMRVTGSPTSDTYSITLHLRQALVIIDTVSWPAVEIPLPEPWDTSWLETIVTPHIDFRRIRILS